MTIITSADRERQRIEHLVDRERQRIEHLVLGRPRPTPELPGRPKDLSRQEWKVRKAQLREAGAMLAPGIEERVSLREKWSHKVGTPETHEQYERAFARPGAIARLWASGAIADNQKDAAEQIAAAYWIVVRDVTVRTASLETRIDGGKHGRAEAERLGAVVTDLAYDRWRRAVGAEGEALLDVIVHDVGLTIVARRLGMGMARARRRLGEVLDLWWQARGAARADAKAILAAA